MNINSAFTSKQLRAADLTAGQEHTFTIKGWAQEKIGHDYKVVLYFHETHKRLPVNKTNGRTIEKLYGSETEAWVGQRITLFVTPVEFQGDMVDGLRIKPVRPMSTPGPAQAPRPNPQPFSLTAKELATPQAPGLPRAKSVLEENTEAMIACFRHWKTLQEGRTADEQRTSFAEMLKGHGKLPGSDGKFSLGTAEWNALQMSDFARTNPEAPPISDTPVVPPEDIPF